MTTPTHHIHDTAALASVPPEPDLPANTDQAAALRALRPVTAELLMTLPVLDRVTVVHEATRCIQHHVPGLRPWSAIEASLEFFHQAGWGQPLLHRDDPGDFIAVADAYVLEALARGVVMALTTENDHLGNPGAPVWCDYVLHLKDDPEWPQSGRAEHDRMWARAEHLATEHGCKQAEDRGARRTEIQYRWYLLSSLYRSLMTEPPAWLSRIGQKGPMAWLSDVTRPAPVHTAAQAAHAIAAFNPIHVARGGVQVGLAYVSDLLT